MSRQFGSCTVYSAGERGMRVELILGRVGHVLDEQEARRLLTDLQRAFDAAWPRPTQPLTKYRQGI